MKSVPYTQHERELCLHAVLDITLDQFFEGLEALSDIPESDPLNIFGGLYVGMLQGDNEPQIGIQALASMSDETLHRFAWYFGPNPLTFDPPVIATE